MNTKENIEKLIIGLEKIIKDSLSRDEELISGLNTIVMPHITNFEPTYKVRAFLNGIISYLLEGLKEQDFNAFSIAIADLLDISKNIYSSSRVHEKTIQSLLSEESYCFGFKPLDLILDNIIDFLDKELFPEGYELFTWFAWDNEFGKKNLSCWLEQGGEEFVISDVNGIVEFIQLVVDKEKIK